MASSVISDTSDTSDASDTSDTSIASATSAPSASSVPSSHWSDRRAQVRKLVLRRLAALPVLILAVSFGIFALASFSPFDPLETYTRGQASALTPEEREQLAETLGINKPWYESWWTWLTHLLTGDLGTSRYYKLPVAEVLGQRLGWTLLLGAVGLVIALILSLFLGLWAGMHRDGIIDRFVSALATLIQALPPFVLALLGLLVFAFWLHALPAGGLTDPGAPVTAGGVIRHGCLPAILLGILQTPWFVLSLRSSVRETLDSDAVTGALVRGLDRRTIMWHHILPTAMPPFIALIGSRLPELIVGSTIVEEIFSWPGLGQAIVQSAQALDFVLLATLTLLVTVVVLLSNMLADAFLVITDPRVDANV